MESHYSDCFQPYPGEKNDISKEGEEDEANVAENPNLEGGQAPVLVGGVEHHGVEDPNLAEEDGDEEGGPGGIGFGRQEEGEPGGDGEHGGGQKVDEQALLSVRVRVRQKVLRKGAKSISAAVTEAFDSEGKFKKCPFWCQD